MIIEDEENKVSCRRSRSGSGSRTSSFKKRKITSQFLLNIQKLIKLDDFRSNNKYMNPRGVNLQS